MQKDTPASPGSGGPHALPGPASGPVPLQFTGHPPRDRREPPEKGPGAQLPTPRLSLASQNNHLSGCLCSHAFPGPLAKKASFVLARAGLEQ